SEGHAPQRPHERRRLLKLAGIEADPAGGDEGAEHGPDEGLLGIGRSRGRMAVRVAIARVRRLHLGDLFVRASAEFQLLELDPVAAADLERTDLVRPDPEGLTGLGNDRGKLLVRSGRADGGDFDDGHARTSGTCPYERSISAMLSDAEVCAFPRTRGFA